MEVTFEREKPETVLLWEALQRHFQSSILISACLSNEELHTKESKPMHIVLVEPEIPGNTGNISRLCAAEHLVLHLVEPLGFSIDDKHLKRAGLDYWDLLEVHVHPDFDSVKRMLAGHHFYYNTTKAIKTYSDISYTEDDVLVFGKETKGLPEELLLEHEEDCIRIPMIEEARSLNLSNAVAIVAMEALRQTGFHHLLKKSGRLFKGGSSHEYV